MEETPEVERLAAAIKADSKAAKAAAVSVKKIAYELGKSDSWTYEMIRGMQPFPLKDFAIWVELTGGKHVAQWVADQVHCDLLPRNQDSDAETTILATMKEVTEAVYTASKALEDGKVTKEELAAYRKEMTEAIEHLRRLGSLLRGIHRQAEESPKRAATLREAEALQHE